MQCGRCQEQFAVYGLAIYCPVQAGRAVRQSPRGEEFGVGVDADAERAVREESGGEPLAGSHHQNVGPPGARTAAVRPGWAAH